MGVGSHSVETFRALWALVEPWQCYFYVTDGWSVHSCFIPEGDQIISKTYRTRVEGENKRLRHYLTRLRRPSKDVVLFQVRGNTAPLD